MPRAKLDGKQIKPDHIHRFTASYDLDARRCECGQLMISRAEMETRQQVWNQYYMDVLKTPAYQIFKDMRQAYRTKDMETVKALGKFIAEQRVERIDEDVWIFKTKDYAPKPTFNDPDTYKYVIKEDYEALPF